MLFRSLFYELKANVPPCPFAPLPSFCSHKNVLSLSPRSSSIRLHKSSDQFSKIARNPVFQPHANPVLKPSQQRRLLKGFGKSLDEMN